MINHPDKAPHVSKGTLWHGVKGGEYHRHDGWGFIRVERRSEWYRGFDRKGVAAQTR